MGYGQALHFGKREYGQDLFAEYQRLPICASQYSHQLTYSLTDQDTWTATVMADNLTAEKLAQRALDVNILTEEGLRDAWNEMYLITCVGYGIFVTPHSLF